MSDSVETRLRASFFDFPALANQPDGLAEQARYLEDGLLTLREGKVVSLERWQPAHQHLASTQVIDLRGKLILPGFVDTHIHYPQTEMIGAFGEQLLEWLNQYTFSVESQYHCAAHATRMSTFFLQQLLANGTTTALVFGTVHPQSVDGAVQRRRTAGDAADCRQGNDGSSRTAGTDRNAGAKLSADARADSALTPRFAPTSSPQLLEKCSS